MELRNQQTGVIITDREFRALHSNTSFPSSIDYSAWGYDVVFESPLPATTRYQTAVRRGAIQAADGKWYANYAIQDLSDVACVAIDAQQVANVRSTRNARLAACDWTQVADSPVDKAAWATYRQELRDITSQPGFPWEITWPVAPQ